MCVWASTNIIQVISMRTKIIILMIFTIILNFNIVYARGVQDNNNDYILRGGDALIITVYDNPDLGSETNNFIVRPDGRLSIPLIGEVCVLNKSIPEFNAEVTDKLREYLINPIVTTSVLVPGKTTVYVLGDIKEQGVFQLSKSHRLLDAISAAKGFSNQSSKKRVVVIKRGKKEPVLIVNMLELLNKGNSANNVLLYDGDLVYITNNNKLVFEDDVLPYLRGILTYQNIENDN